MWHVIGIIIRYFPVVLGVLLSIEAVVNPSTPGADKRAAAVAAISKALAAFGVVLSEAQLEALGKVIDGVIGVFNLLGVFRKKADLPPEELAAADAAAKVTPVEVNARVMEVAATDETFAAFLRATER